MASLHTLLELYAAAEHAAQDVAPRSFASLSLLDSFGALSEVALAPLDVALEASAEAAVAATTVVPRPPPLELAPELVALLAPTPPRRCRTHSAAPRVAPYAPKKQRLAPRAPAASQHAMSRKARILEHYFAEQGALSLRAQRALDLNFLTRRAEHDAFVASLADGVANIGVDSSERAGVLVVA